VLPKIVLAGSLAAALFGTVNCAEADESGFAKDCQTHFASEGSFLVGRKYTTWIEFPAVLKDDAYSRVYASIAKDGWNIVNADKPAGQKVRFGRNGRAQQGAIAKFEFA
jgi:hypothetical protein